jgi:hypothetical protein
MSIKASEEFREAIRRTLVQRAGSGTNAGMFASATLGIWQEVSTLLLPMIGSQGVEALLKRTLHLSGGDFPWLACLDDQQGNVNLLADLNQLISQHETEIAKDACHFIFETFIDLLISLIGVSLTERLLKPISIQISDASGKDAAL